MGPRSSSRSSPRPSLGRRKRPTRLWPSRTNPIARSASVCLFVFLYSYRVFFFYRVFLRSPVVAAAAAPPTAAPRAQVAAALLHLRRRLVLRQPVARFYRVFLRTEFFFVPSFPCFDAFFFGLGFARQFRVEQEPGFDCVALRLNRYFYRVFPTFLPSFFSAFP